MALMRHKRLDLSHRGSIIKIALQADSSYYRLISSFSPGVGTEGGGEEGDQLEMGQGVRG